MVKKYQKKNNINSKDDNDDNEEENDHEKTKYNLRKRKRVDYNEEKDKTLTHKKTKQNNLEIIEENDSGNEEYEEYEYSDEEDLDDFIVNDEEHGDDFSYISYNHLEKIKQEDEEAYNNLLEVQEELDKKFPNIVEILKADLSVKHKCQLVELYQVLIASPYMSPNTEEWLGMREKINKLYEKYKEEYKIYSKNQQKLKTLEEKFEKDNKSCDVKYKILSLNSSDEVKKILYHKYNRLKELEISDGQEYVKLKRWIDSALKLPFNNIKKLPFKKKNFTTFLQNVSEQLDNELYGMKDVKQQILLFLNNRLLSPEQSGCSLGLIGPPGVGKTTIAKCISKVLDWPFQQISFGGVNEPEFLKGHDFTYVGSQAGEIAKCMQRMKYSNGIMFFDEYEKISDNKNITSLLLHVTDFQQNSEFQDNYLSNIKIDLSKLWFIYSMNSLPKDSALRDRIYKIEIPAYKMDEKIEILIRHVLPKILKKINLKKDEITISKENAKYFIDRIDKGEAGIRNIEQNTKNLINKLSFLLNHQDKKGKIKGFDSISFNIDKKLKLPLEIDKDVIDKLCKSKEPKNPSLEMMYM